MRIWLIYPHGLIPGEGLRQDRSSMISESLSQVGHEVTVWISAFDHITKSFYAKDWSDIEISRNYKIRLVPTTGYEKHISLARICSLRTFAMQVLNRATKYAPPDVIIMWEPALFISKWILEVVEKTNAKLILDIVDLWPELFRVILPAPMNKIEKLLFAPLYARRRRLFKKAHAITAVSESYLSLGKDLAPHLDPNKMATIYWGINLEKERIEKIKNAQLAFPLQGLNKSSEEIWIIFASTLGNNYDLKTILHAALLLEREHLKIRLLIAGEGPLKNYVISFIKNNNLKQVTYVGNLDSITMSRVFAFCDIGLSAYVRSSTVAMPIKVFHYLAAGLPIVNSLRGELEKILKIHSAGLQFEAGKPESLAGAIQELCSDSDQRALLSRNAIKLAESFDWKLQYAKYVDLVEKVNAEGNKNSEV